MTTPHDPHRQDPATILPDGPPPPPPPPPAQAPRPSEPGIAPLPVDPDPPVTTPEPQRRPADDKRNPSQTPPGRRIKMRSTTPAGGVPIVIENFRASAPSAACGYAGINLGDQTMLLSLR